MSKNKCYHCKHGGNTFKVNELTHLHCLHPKQKEEYRKNPKYSSWDTLREWWDTCKDFESKNTPEDEK